MVQRWGPDVLFSDAMLEVLGSHSTDVQPPHDGAGATLCVVF